MPGEGALVGRPRYVRESPSLLGRGGEERKRRQEEDGVARAERAHVRVAERHGAAADRVDHVLRSETAGGVVLVDDLDEAAGALPYLAREARIGPAWIDVAGYSLAMLQRIVCGGATPAASRAMTTASIRARRVIWESTSTPARRLVLAVAAG